MHPSSILAKFICWSLLLWVPVALADPSDEPELVVEAAAAEIEDSNNKSDKLTFDDLVDSIKIVKIISDAYLMSKLEPALRNEVERFAERVSLDPNGFGASWFYEVGRSLSYKVISSLTETTYLRALPNLVRGRKIFDNLTGALLRPNHIPVDLLDNSEPFLVTEKMGYRFLKIGPKATGKWRNFFKFLALAGFDNLTDALVAGSAMAITKDVFLAQMYNAKMHKANESFSSFTNDFQTDGRPESLLKNFTFRAVNVLMHYALTKFKDHLLPNYQLTGFYTIKDGVIYHVEHDTRSERRRHVEMLANHFSYYPPKRAELSIAEGMFELGPRIFPHRSRRQRVFDVAKGVGSFVIDEVMDFYLGSAIYLTYRGVDKVTGRFMSEKVFGEHLGRYDRSVRQTMAYDFADEKKMQLSQLIKEVMVKPFLGFIWRKMTRKQKQEDEGYIGGITKIDGHFHYLKYTEEFQFRLFEQTAATQ